RTRPPRHLRRALSSQVLLSAERSVSPPWLRHPMRRVGPTRTGAARRTTPPPLARRTGNNPHRTTRMTTDYAAGNCQRVAPPGSTVARAVAVRGTRRYTCQGGRPAEGAL